LGLQAAAKAGVRYGKAAVGKLRLARPGKGAHQAKGVRRVKAANGAAAAVDVSNREEMMKQFDKDGDGELNEEERNAMRTAMRERMGTGQGGGERRRGGRR
jgi:hypothetical protein